MKRALSIILAVILTVTSLPISLFAEDSYTLTPEQIAELVSGESSDPIISEDVPAASGDSEAIADDTMSDVSEVVEGDSTPSTPVDDADTAPDDGAEQDDTILPESPVEDTTIGETDYEDEIIENSGDEVVVDENIAETYSTPTYLTESVTASGTCGENLTWTLSDDGVLTISGTGEMTNYSSSSAPWKNYRSLIKSVIIEDGVTSIGNYAFYYCSKLTSITIPNGVTSIGYDAFYGCSSLTSITIPDSVTSIGNYAFILCSSLTSVHITDLESWCNISFSSYNSNPLSYAKNLYLNGELVTDLVIPEGVTSIGNYAFANCSSLTSITIPDSVSSIGNSAFRDCSNLTSIVFKSANTTIYDSSYTISSTATIYGYESSTAQAYADNYSRTFVKLCDGNHTFKRWEHFDGNTHARFCIDITCDGAEFEEHQYNGTHCSVCGHVKNTEGLAWGYCGDDLSWILCDDGTLVILGSGTMTDYTYSSSAPWYSYRSSIKSVIIEDGVTSIGNYTFYNCSSLARVTIPDSVTSIGYDAFSGCSSLTSVTIGNSVTSIGKYAFMYCSSLTSIVFKSANTTIYDSSSTISSTATIYGYEGSTAQTYADNYSRTFVKLCDGNHTFKRWEHLDGNTHARFCIDITCDGAEFEEHQYNDTHCSVCGYVKNTEGLAWGYCGDDLSWILCDDGTLVILGSGTMTDYTFSSAPWYSYRSSIKSVIIEDGVTSIGNYAFNGCSKLTSITIPDSVTSIGEDAFYNCSSLTSITIPDSVTNIGNYAFYDCSRLARIVFKSANAAIYDSSYTISSKAAIYGYEGSTAQAYAEKYSRTFIALKDDTITTVVDSGICGDSLTWTLTDDGVLTISGTGKMADYGFSSSAPWYSYNLLVTDINIETSVTSIGAWAFDDCLNLTSIAIPDGVTSIGNYTFYNCSSLTSITIPDSVTYIGSGAFSGCSSLTTIDADDANGYYADVDGVLFNKSLTELVAYPAGKTETTYIIPSSVTSIGYRAFDDCLNLTSITIPNSVTSISDDAFYKCSSLTSVTIPNGVTNIGDSAFAYCSSLTAIEVDDTNEYYADVDGVLFDKSLSTLIQYPSGKTQQSYVIPDGVTSIGNNAFRYCSSLTSVTIPDSVTSIGNYAFYDCSKLTSVTIGNGVTSIGYSAFRGCSSLTSVSIPDSVTSIGSYAFWFCSSLTSVTIGNSVTSIGSSAFDDCSSLTSVHITDLKSWCNITFGSVDSNPLYYAKNLYLNGELVTDLVIPEGVTSIGNYAFANCSSLTSIAIPDSVTSIGNQAFYGCSSLTSVIIPYKVTSIGNKTFGSCNSLTTVVFESAATTIYDSSDTITASATIYGYTNSTAKAYAEEYNRTFVDITTLTDKFDKECFKFNSTVLDDGRVVLTWDPINDADEFIVYYREAGNTKWKAFVSTDTTVTINFGSTGTYEFKVYDGECESQILSISPKEAYTFALSQQAASSDESTMILRGEVFGSKNYVLNLEWSDVSSIYKVYYRNSGSNEWIGGYIRNDESIQILLNNFSIEDSIEIKIVTGEYKFYTFVTYPLWMYTSQIGSMLMTTDLNLRVLATVSKSINLFIESQSSSPGAIVINGKRIWDQTPNNKSEILSADHIKLILSGNFEANSSYKLYNYSSNENEEPVLIDTVYIDSFRAEIVFDLQTSILYDYDNNTWHSGFYIDGSSSKIYSVEMYLSKAGSETVVEELVASVSGTITTYGEADDVYAQVFRICDETDNADAETVFYKQTVLSNTTGTTKYKINNLLEGNYIIRVYKPGYEFEESYVTVGTANITLDFTIDQVMESCEHVMGELEVLSNTKHIRYCTNDDCKSYEISSHIWNKVMTIDATCSKNGADVYLCECGGTKLEVVSATGEHTWDDGVVTTEPTCAIVGVMTYTCICSETKTESIPVTGEHDYSGSICRICNHINAEIVRSGSCYGDNIKWALTTDGELLVYGAGKMSDYFLTSSIPWYSYGPSIKSVVVNDGVTTIGSSAFMGCTNLINVTIPDSVTSIGSYAFDDCTSLTSIVFKSANTTIYDSKYTISSNATIYGYEGSTAEAYAEKYSRKFCTIHSECIFDSWQNLNGVSHIRYCTAVNCVWSEVLPHEFDEGVITTEPTCATDGVKTSTCTDCGATYTESIPATGNHTYGGWKKYDGDKHIHYCTGTDCEAYETADHIWNNGNVTTQPTCATQGVKTFTCSDCGATYTESIPATGNHTYGGWKKYDGDKHIHYCTGTDCEAYETVDHIWNNGVASTEPACATEGVKTFTCSDCGATYTEPIPVTGNHTYGEWEQYDEPNHIRYCTGDDCNAFETEPHEYSGSFDMNCNICDHEKASSGDFGENMSWQVTEDGALSIDGSGDVDVSDDAPWNEYLDGITSVTVSENVASIDADMFEGMTNLAIIMILSNDVVIEDSASAIPSYVVIYGYAGSTAELYASKYGREFVNMSVTAGDVNDDGSVDKNDAIYLLYSVLFGDTTYPLNQTCDFNGDSSVDKNDAIYLLYHALFGAVSYPLN